MLENKILKLDLHIHSNYSPDSRLTIENIVNRAMERGLDGIAICDHDTTEGSKQAAEYVKKLNLPLLVIHGIEVSTAQGHLLILGIRNSIPPNLTVEETIRIARRIAEQNGNEIVIVAAHPFKRGGIGGINGLDIDAVETFNSRCVLGENKKAKEMAHRLEKAETGGSDSHLLMTIGRGFTLVRMDSDPDEKSVLKAIKDGESYSSGKIVPLYVLLFQAGRKIASKLLHKFSKSKKTLRQKNFCD